MATCMAIYVNAAGFPGAYRLVWIASLLLVARGVAVPSTVSWTFWISMSAPAALAVLLGTLGRG